MGKNFLYLLLLKIIINKQLEENEIIKLCKKCESNFNLTYNDKELLNNTSKNDKINSYVIKFIKILETDFNSSQIIEEYAKPRVIYPNIIFIILIIILLIIWGILIFLVCKNKKYFKFNVNQDNITHFKIYYLYYLTLFFLIIIIIISSILIYFIYEISLYFNGSICALFRIYIDVRDGDQSNLTYWKGIRNIQKDLITDKNTVIQLINNIDLQENITYELINNNPNKKFSDKTFYDEEEKNNFYADIQVSSPNPSSIIKVYPEYSMNRRINLDNIYLEYMNKLYKGVLKNEEITILNSQIKNNSNLLNLINSEFFIVNNYLNDILETIQMSAEEYLQYLVDYSKKVNKFVFPILYSIFISSILLSLSGIIFLTLYIKLNNKKNIFFYVLQIIWNLKLILLILAILAEIIFKIFKIFGDDGAGVFQYATSEENLQNSDSVIFKGTGKIFLKMCFNNENNGDLLRKILENIDYNNSKLNELKSLELNEIWVKDFYNQMEKTQLEETQKLCEDLNSLYIDYSLISYYDLLKLKSAQDDLDNLNLFTDYSSPFSYQNPLGNKHSYDVWTTSKENCYNKYNSYKYIYNESNRNEGNKYCMVLEEFDKNIAKNFYKGISCISLKDVDENFMAYYESLGNFNKQNKIYLKENPNFIQITKNYYDELILIKNIILEGLNYSKNIVNLISKIFHTSPEDYEFVDLFNYTNCKFLERDSKVFFIQMDKLSGNSNTLFIICIFLLFFKLSSAILIICNIYKYKKEEILEDRESSFNSNLVN